MLLNSVASVHIALQLMGDPTSAKLEALGFILDEDDPTEMWTAYSELFGFEFRVEVRHGDCWSCLLMINNEHATSALAPLGVIGESLWHFDGAAWSFSRGLM
jgi:hypothetical protein